MCSWLHCPLSWLQNAGRLKQDEKVQTRKALPPRHSNANWSNPYEIWVNTPLFVDQQRGNRRKAIQVLGFIPFGRLRRPIQAPCLFNLNFPDPSVQQFHLDRRADPKITPNTFFDRRRKTYMDSKPPHPVGGGVVCLPDISRYQVECHFHHHPRRGGWWWK